MNRYGVTRSQIEALLAAAGQPRYRAEQVWDVLTRQRQPLETATNLPKALREQLGVDLPLALEPVVELASHDGHTRKWLWRVGGGFEIETVLMEYPDRATVCVSTQAGCAMACSFCATGQAGFDRHLDAGEIVEQVVRAQHATEQRVGNVVFMGMGEPLANYAPVVEALERLAHDFGISARHLTVSTVGVVPGMRKLAHHELPVTLAVSLHAPTDDLRAELVPLNHRYPIKAVLAAAAEYADAKGRRVTFEYACIAGVNDRPEHARLLAQLLSEWPGRGGAHVNLIPLNPTAGYGGRTPGGAAVRDLAATLEAHGVAATVRHNRGVDIDAACGQLRARNAS